MLKHIYCPNCGASIKDEPKDNRYQCPYCLSTFQLADIPPVPSPVKKKMPVKNIGIAVAVLACICLVAVFFNNSGNDAPPAPVTNPPSSSTPPSTDLNLSPREPATTSVDQSAVSTDEMVLVDQDGIRILFTELTFEYSRARLKVLIENNSGANIMVSTEDASINGIMIDTTLFAQVSDGKKSNDEISVYISDLETAGIEVIKDIELKFQAYDSSSYNVIFETGLVSFTIPGNEDYVQPYHNTGHLIMEQGGVKVHALGLSTNSGTSRVYLDLFIENHSGRDLMLVSENESVNGYMIDPYFMCSITDGKVAYDAITFSLSDLQKNNISEIEDIELNFYVIDTASYRTIFTGDTLKIEF